MDKKKYFLEIFRRAEKKYGKKEKRLAGEGWNEIWKTLIVTIMSAQSRDETTIPIAEKLFKRYGSLEKLAHAKYEDVLEVFRSLNYNRTKVKNVIAATKFIRDEFNGKVPNNLEELIRIPGVGRKTANLVRWESFGEHGICVDTHVHRISNVFGFVKTKNPEQTEKELERIVPKKLWGKVNRIFVLWGKDVRGRNKKDFLNKLK